MEPARVADDGALNDDPGVEEESCSKGAPWGAEGAEGRPAIKASIAAALKKGSMAAGSSDSSVEDEEAGDVGAVDSGFNGVGGAAELGSADTEESAESEALDESESLESWARRSVALAAAAREATERSIHWAKESWPSWVAGAREEAEKSGAPEEGVEAVA